ncbi:TetR/AcrR family transcriptional regulator [Kaistella jeonii]|uniref:TetR family transcriptional regulator n=1 Tax=Kaistella jeonii TaxID=266749 RepID=A0A0C1D139_9FLAO|nr:TetR/AcrR family transcriptional regulator [Kaistella jeonii]KIA90431.1 TetR family transcriptional regulator [Kaistella jeonii]SFB72989.1 DNA-binding transcriptional regulator, AcrR family [Kaistella jeonii]VEI95009.1 putative DNA-binding transcriptional regulator [Kaistella jeonii]
MISKEENILFNAEKLFAEKGFEGTSIREISKEANVNVSMISYYFGSKEKLFEKIFEFRMNESLSFAKDVIADKKMNEWEKLIVVINRYTDRVKNLKTFYLIMQREQLTNKNEHIVKVLNESKMGFLEIYKQLIESGLKNKVFTKRPRLEFIHSTISGTIFSALNSLPIYKKFYKGDEKYENLYFEDLNNHIKNVLKYLLGYEENK